MPVLEQVNWNTSTRVFTIAQKKIQLTKTEYSLLFLLRGGKPVTYEEMSEIVYNSQMDKYVYKSIEKHIDRIRRKMKGTGFYVYCVWDYGYVLLPRKERVK